MTNPDTGRQSTRDLTRLLALVDKMPPLPPQPKTEAQIRHEARMQRRRNNPRPRPYGL